MIALIIWSAIVTSFATTTHTYQKCKDKECKVVVQEIGYKIEEVVK